MPNILRLDLDITGTNIDNFIENEPHNLSNRPTRSIAPDLGPFFAHSLIVKDSGSVLSRGQDYQIVELHQEATLKYGKEIASVILIINSNVSSTVTISYNALGGYYSYDDKAIANLYETVIQDNRPVDWSNVFNKPTEFNPTVHRHLLDDVYGFEPVVDYLERIKRAITMGQSGIVLEIVNSLLSKFECSELPKILPSNKLIQYDALLYFLSRRKILNNIWVDRKECKWVKGNSVNLEVDTSGYPVGTTLYWELYKPQLNVGLFTCKSGNIKTNGGITEIILYIPSDPHIVENPIYLGIKEHPDDEDFKAVTYTLDIQEHISTDCAYGHMLYSAQDGDDRYWDISRYDNNDELRIYYQMTRY
jgi:hypothetical protein